MADGITLADLNEKHIKGCIRLGVEGGRIPASAISVPIEETLVKWKLLKNGVPTNGATMLFSDNIDEYPQFRLRMARFVGTDKNAKKHHPLCFNSTLVQLKAVKNANKYTSKSMIYHPFILIFYKHLQSTFNS